VFCRTSIVLAVLLSCQSADAAQAQGTDRSWAAIAVFCPPARGGCKGIAGGGGYGRTKGRATKAAVADCVNGDIDLSDARYCKIIRAYNRGCAYVVAGCNKASSVCGYALAGTEPEAERNCASQGFNCSDPAFVIGGCVGN
jgi:hypothetical protein